MSDESLPNADNGEQPVLLKLAEFVLQGKDGDPAVVPEIRNLFNQHPEIWQHYGDLAKHVENKWLDLIAGSDVCVRESVKAKLDEMRAEAAAG